MTLVLHLYRRLLRRGRLIALLVLAAVPGFVLWLAGLDTAQGRDRLYSDIVATAGFTFAVAALILTVATLREEREDGTLPYLYMRPIRRTWLAGSSIVAGAGAALTLAMGAWLATLFAAAGLGVEAAAIAPGIVLFALAAVGYAAVFVPLGYLVPRALLFGLGYVVIVESVLAAVVSGFAQLSIWRIALSVYADINPVFGPDAGSVLGPVTPGAGGGLLKLAGMVVVGLTVLTWALRYRDAL